MIQIINLSIELGAFQLSDVSLTIPSGAYGVLMGRTGSGKTTVLECIIGLRPVKSGTILIDGRVITDLNPALRGIGYVPQDGALFSKMTVQEHLEFALVIRRAKRDQIAHRVQELASMLGITHLLKRRPAGLSGGEAQRVSLGRALSFSPAVLCLDEPLSALDSQTHEQMCELLAQIGQQTQVTILHVTHNQREAERLSDCLFRLEDGQLIRDK